MPLAPRRGMVARNLPADCDGGADDGAGAVRTGAGRLARELREVRRPP